MTEKPLYSAEDFVTVPFMDAARNYRLVNASEATDAFNELQRVAAEIANALLCDYFKEHGVTVYGRVVNGKPSHKWVKKPWASRPTVQETRAEAILVGIRELKGKT